MDDIITESLKKTYFDLLQSENIPHTPQITAKEDELERAIRSRESQAKVVNANPS